MFVLLPLDILHLLTAYLTADSCPCPACRSITLTQILLGVQDLLNNPNEKSPAQSEAFMDYTQRRRKYEARVKQEVAKYPSKI